MADGDRVSWLMLLYATLSAFIIFIPVALCEPDISVLLYVVVVIPLISTFMLIGAFRKKSRQRLSILLVLAVYWAISAILLANYSVARDVSRWLVWSRGYKLKVQSEPAPANGDLKHIEWDGWGWAGSDTTVFLVFDPTDSLSAAAKSRHPGKFDGIPCEVDVVHRMERHWYTVQFYTDEYWGKRNSLDCGHERES